MASHSRSRIYQKPKEVFCQGSGLTLTQTKVLNEFQWIGSYGNILNFASLISFYGFDNTTETGRIAT